MTRLKADSQALRAHLGAEGKSHAQLCLDLGWSVQRVALSLLHLIFTRQVASTTATLDPLFKEIDPHE